MFKFPSHVAAHIKYKGNPALVQAGKDSIDGGLGLGFLLIGFVLQATAYLVLLDRESPRPLGTDSRITGVALLVTAAALPWLVWLLVRRRLLLRYIRTLALYDNQGTKHAHPDIGELVEFAGIIGEERQADEYDDDGRKRFAQRVFGVGQFRDGPVPLEEFSEE